MSRALAAAALLWLILAGGGVRAEAAEATPASALHASLPWARATTADALSAAIYLTLSNPTAVDEVLRGASCDGCDHCELHVHRLDAQGMMHMSEVDHLSIPAHGQLVLQPGAIHLMLLGLAHGLSQGQRLHLVLRLDDGTCTLTVPVVGSGASGPDG